MPYIDECTCPDCIEARTRYSVEINRTRYVRAREHGLSRYDSREYVEAMVGLSNAQNPRTWQDARENDEATCAGCGACEDECCCDSEPERAADEQPLSLAMRRVTFAPLARMLRRGGRYWSSEVEINMLDEYAASRVLSAERESYGHKATAAGTIIVTSDCTCDAEIKIGRMRDGATMTQRARDAYDTLRNAGAACGYNTGHHVHVDASRIVLEGADAVETVLRASLTLASACNPTLVALAASGYDQHRDELSEEGYGGSLKTSHSRALTGRTAWHATNAHYVANNGRDYGIPTFEYRLPNGTLEPIRAHAHIATALGLLDFGERCKDGDADALDHLRQAEERIGHAQDWSEADGAAILTRALQLHPDSLKALAIAAKTSPATPMMASTLAIAAA